MNDAIENIDFAAVVTTLEDNWDDFVEWSGGEDSAELTLAALKQVGDLA